MGKNKILVTGFRPFLGESVNPSELILGEIQNKFEDEVRTLLLPVSFYQSSEMLLSHLEQNDYDLILLLGQAGGRAKISLERVALNWIETEHPDEDQYRPEQGPIFPDSDEVALFTSLPISQWKEDLNSSTASVEVSLSAGGYVCNFLYFQTLKWLREKNKANNVCFIHVPYLSEQVVNKVNVPAMSLHEMSEIIFKILKWHL